MKFYFILLFLLAQEFAKRKTLKKTIKATEKLAAAAAKGDVKAAALEDSKKDLEKIEGHIMMSYQWANQEVVKQIRDVLRAAVNCSRSEETSKQATKIIRHMQARTYSSSVITSISEDKGNVLECH